jgi:hypothetical protein
MLDSVETESGGVGTDRRMDPVSPLEEIRDYVAVSVIDIGTD